MGRPESAVTGEDAPRVLCDRARSCTRLIGHSGLCASEATGRGFDRLTWGSYASALRDRRTIIIRTIAETLASGGPIEDEMDAAEQVVEALERLYGVTHPGSNRDSGSTEAASKGEGS